MIELKEKRLHVIVATPEGMAAEREWRRKANRTLPRRKCDCGNCGVITPIGGNYGGRLVGPAWADLSAA